MPNPTPEEMAGKLTKAQRRFLNLLPKSGRWRETSASELDNFGPNALRGFGKSGLVEGYYHDPMRFRLTPLGLAVRDILKEQSK